MTRMNADMGGKQPIQRGKQSEAIAGRRTGRLGNPPHELRGASEHVCMYGEIGEI